MLRARDKSREMCEALYAKLQVIMDSDDEQAAPEPHTGTDPSPSGDVSEGDADEEPALSEPASLEAAEGEQSQGIGEGPSGVPSAAHASSEHAAAGAEGGPAAEDPLEAGRAPVAHDIAADAGRAVHPSAAAAASATAAAGAAHSSSAKPGVADAGGRIEEPSLVNASGSVS